MNYLLDTNVVIALLKNRPAQVRKRYREAQASGDDLAVSSVVLFELWYRVAKSSGRPPGRTANAAGGPDNIVCAVADIVAEPAQTPGNAAG